MRYCARRRAAACCGTLACTVASSARALARSPSSPRPADTMAWITRRLSSWVRRLARATAAARRHAARNNCAPPRRRPRCGPAPDRRPAPGCARPRPRRPGAAEQIDFPGRVEAGAIAPGQIALALGAGIGLRQAALVAAAGRDGRQLVQLPFIQHGARLGQPGLGDADVVVALQRQADQPVQLRILQLLPPVALQLAVGEQRLFGAGQRHRRGLRLCSRAPLRSPPRPGPAPARRPWRAGDRESNASCRFPQADAPSSARASSSRARGVSPAARWSRANTVYTVGSTNSVNRVPTSMPTTITSPRL